MNVIPKEKRKQMKCSECPDFWPSSNGKGVCEICGGGITWNPNEIIDCDWKEV